MAFLNGEHGDTQAEIDGYKRALEIDEYYAEPLYNLAITYKDLGDTDKAVDCYLEALKREPWHIKTLENLAWIYYDYNHINEALEFMFKLIKANQYRDKSYDSFAAILLKAKQYQLLEKLLLLWEANVRHSISREEFLEKANHDG